MRNLYNPIITSLMDTDFYKLTMGQINFHRYAGSQAVYKFKCRNQGINLSELIPALRYHIHDIASLSFRENEIRWLKGLGILSSDYLHYLSMMRLDPNQVHVKEVGGELSVEIRGSMLTASPWEIYLLAVINELYFRMTVPEPDYEEGRRRLMNKIADAKASSAFCDLRFADFGTRRRFSREWQRTVVETLKKSFPSEVFVGTSNLLLAMNLDLRPIGTMAHEYQQASQSLVHPLNALRHSLDEWEDEFRGDLGIALTDVIGMEAFCDVLDAKLANGFEGFRHDSGDPIWWGEMLVKKLQSLGIDPTSKTAVFSDGLTMNKMLELTKHFSGRIKVSHGWGTNLTNDLGHSPLNIVIKIIELDGRPVAKLSDSPGKTMCEDENYVKWLAASYGRLEEFVA